MKVLVVAHLSSGFIAAALEGDLDMLKFLKETECPFYSGTKVEVVIAAAKGGHLETLKWLKEEDCLLPRKAYSAACESGLKSVKVLRWLRGNGCLWNSKAHMAATQNGNFEALKWLYKTSKVHYWS